ncbi:MAG TPA: divalent-cation tolerance protein CutA [Caulobacterales bacterium]|nr:divalent-cation tolerance protein CutA [Caulobacterales bacterium]
MDSVTLYSTWPDMERAEATARRLVEHRLVACVTLTNNAVSIFRWDSTLQRENEVVMLAKTTAERAGEARDALLAAHPYDLPCVTAFRIDPAHSSAPFLNWVQEETL